MTSASPLMSPGESRQRRRRSIQRRRARRRALAVGALVLAIAAGLVAIVLAGGADHGSSSAHASVRGAAKADAVPLLSPAGLPLGKPPLVLSGLANPLSDPLLVSFHSPPRAGLLFNLDTGQVLWQRDPQERLHIASLTKMMTALLAVRSGPASTPVLVTRQAIDSAGSKVGVLPLGRRVRIQTMLYGLLLPSGNDAAVALAQHVSGTVSAFVTAMNAEAAHLGLACTHYSSPSGYYDSDNFSCAADLAVLAHVDLEQPRLATIVRTYTAALPFPIAGGKLYLENNNPLLIYGYPGLTGLKTGYTASAGRCLVATAERHGVRLGVVLLHSPDPGNQASRLLNLGFERIYHQAPVREPPIPAGA